MRHFVQYHNTEERGYPCEEIRTFEIVTRKKNVQPLLNNKVWLISGQDRPRQYRLCYVFIVDELGPTQEPGFYCYARGKHGHRFHPPLPLNLCSWFKSFLASQQNFRWGLCEITQTEYIAPLELLESEDKQVGKW